MNPFNCVWIALTWILAGCAIAGYCAGDFRLPLVVAIVEAVLITGQTIGVDRAERDTDSHQQ